MKKYLNYLWKKKIMLLIVLVSSFLLGFTISSVYNTYNSSYSIRFTVNNEAADFLTLNDGKELLETQEALNKKNSYYKDINVKKMIDKKDFVVTYSSITKEYEITTKTSYYDTFFLAKSNTVSTRAKTFIKTALNNYAKKNNATVSYSYNDILVETNPLPTYAIYLISTGTLMLLTSTYILITYLAYKKYGDLLLEETSKEHIYKTPFHKQYWKDALKVFKSTKNITTIAMLFGLMLICKFFSLPSGFSNLGIGITYLVFATIGMIYGPIAGLIIGLLSDTIGYFLIQQSAYAWFFGYSIQAALTGFIYGICLYKTELTYTKCFVSRILVNFLMNVVLGSICWGIVCSYTAEQTYFYALIFSLPKNIIYLVPQSLVLYFVLQALAPILARYNLIDEEQIETIIKKRKYLTAKSINNIDANN